MEPMKDLIILLPGIMGSVLQHNGSDLWTVSSQSIFNFITSFGGNLSHLKLDGDDYKKDDLGDGVTATALMSDTVIIPGFWKIDGYTKISKVIQQKFDVIKGDVNSLQPANYYEFYYDWRRDNRVAARQLQTLIERQLPVWRQHSGDASAKVVLIGHSMGGLIARHYLEVEGGWKDCRMLITFGTPYRGSLKSLNYLANGYQNWVVNFTDIVRSLTSSYQLLPIYKSVSVNGNFERVSEIDNFPNVDKARAAAARQFHLAIKDAVETNRKDQNYLDNFSMVPVIGNKQSTLQSGKLITAPGVTKFEVSEDLPDSQLPASGDGTVPMTSSIPIELKISAARPFIEQHGSLQNNDDVLKEIEFLLKNLRTDKILPQSFGPNDQAGGINLALEDLYFAGEAVEMSATLINPVDYPKKLNAIFENLDDKTVHKGEFLPETDKWEMIREPLPQGRYRIKVEPDDPTLEIKPVRGLFSVAPA